MVAAYKLPKGTSDEQQARKAAIQDALRAATDVPLDVMRLSAPRSTQAGTIAAHGHRAAASDVGVAIDTLRAGTARRAASTSRSIWAASSDAAYVDAVRDGGSTARGAGVAGLAGSGRGCFEPAA